MIIKNIKPQSLCIVTGGKGLLKHSKFYIISATSKNTSSIIAKIVVFRNGKAGKRNIILATKKINIVYDENTDITNSLVIDIIKNKYNILELSSIEYAAYITACFENIKNTMPYKYSTSMSRKIDESCYRAMSAESICMEERCNTIHKLLKLKQLFNVNYDYNIKNHINSFLRKNPFIKNYNALLKYEYTHNSIT
jgi:hypothetical protein